MIGSSSGRTKMGRTKTGRQKADGVALKPRRPLR